MAKTTLAFPDDDHNPDGDHNGDEDDLFADAQQPDDRDGAEDIVADAQQPDENKTDGDDFDPAKLETDVPSAKSAGHDPFDPAFLALSQDFAADANVKKAWDIIRVEKPSKARVFRVHPDFQLGIAVSRVFPSLFASRSKPTATNRMLNSNMRLNDSCAFLNNIQTAAISYQAG